MNLIEQYQNIQQYGDKGGIMNLAAVEKEILDHRDARRQRNENEETIKKLLYEVVKIQGDRVIQKAIADLLRDF